MTEQKRRELEARLAVALEGWGWLTIVDKDAAFRPTKYPHEKLCYLFPPDVLSEELPRGWVRGQDPEGINLADNDGLRWWNHCVPEYTEDMNAALRLCGVLMARWSAVEGITNDPYFSLTVFRGHTTAHIAPPCPLFAPGVAFVGIDDTPALALCMALDAAVKEGPES